MQKKLLIICKVNNLPIAIFTTICKEIINSNLSRKLHQPMNDEYYILVGETKKGPYTFDDLINMDLTIHTEIITPLSDEPQFASELPEFNEYFEAQGIYFPTEDNLAPVGKRISAFL